MVKYKQINVIHHSNKRNKNNNNKNPYDPINRHGESICKIQHPFLRRALKVGISSVQFSHSVMFDSMRPHGLQQARPPCPSPTPRVYSKSCALSRWCHPTILSSVVPFPSCLQSFPSFKVFSKESVLCIRWPKYWSFSLSISPSNEYPRLISFRTDRFDLLAVQGKAIFWYFIYPMMLKWTFINYYPI